MTRASLSLRIASVVSFLFAAGHSAGGMSSWAVEENAAFSAMRSVSFHTTGVTRTYLDFYRGFGWTLTVFLLLQAVVLWQLASIAKTDPYRARPMVVAFLIATVVSALITWRLILPVPLVFDVVIAVALAAAVVP